MCFIKKKCLTIVDKLFGSMAQRSSAFSLASDHGTHPGFTAWDQESQYIRVIRGFSVLLPSLNTSPT